jgi:hypothetical protein
MLRVNDELKKYGLVAAKYTTKGNVTIVDTDNGKVVFKNNNNLDIFKYLDSRDFDYYPKIISDDNDSYVMMEYIDSVDMPIEQKLDDMVDLVGLLHSKTTYYQDASIDDYTDIYEDIKNNVEYLYSYYNDLMAVIESKVFMSPAEYTLSINISNIYKSLSICNDRIDEWYKKVKDKNKKRLVVLHNNLDLSHFIRNDRPYLISWDKSKIDIPVFDLYKLYKNNINFNFEELLKRYEKINPLSDDERDLLIILLSLPDKIEFDGSNYNMCIKIRNMIKLLTKLS